MSERSEPSAPAPDTFHAPAARAPTTALRPLAESLQNNHVVQALLDGYPEVAVLLNEHRQIVACNQALLTSLGVTELTSVVGRRIGEVLACIHATEQAGGCGTSETCRTCGAVNSILQCQKTGEAIHEECRISTGSVDNPGAWEFQVVATPLKLDDLELMIFAARDIGAIKRRAALERLFFHDTLNVAGGIQGLADLLEGGEAFSPDVHPARLHALSRQLIEQIRAQRDLAAAERGTLTPSWSTIVIDELFDDLRAAYETHPVAKDRTIKFVAQIPDGWSMQSDRVLLNRVLGNLIKNALEASEPGGRVAVRCALANGDQVRFSVHNATVMPRNVQLQVFKRSFSTKGGTGRGLGTFSVKLLTTQHLGGQVAFESDQGRGTTFLVTLPRCRTEDWQPQVESAVRAQGDANLTGRRVLLAEDGEDNQRLIAHVLKKAGAEVIVVENGKLAAEAAMKAHGTDHAFDVILMDMQMPVMDGYEATRKLRQDGYAGPIIALTAHSSASDRKECIAAGSDSFASKPVERHELIDMIQRQLKPAEAVSAQAD